MARNKTGPIGEPICSYCGQSAELVHSSEIYGGGNGDGRSRGLYWLCRKDGAYVGCHEGGRGDVPLGSLANKELRIARQSVHAVFDPLWRAKMRRDQCPKHEARGAAYNWLAEQMGIEIGFCHIAMFDLQQCRQAREICNFIGRED